MGNKAVARSISHIKELVSELNKFPPPTALDIQKAEVAALTCKTTEEFCEFLDIDELTFKIWATKSPGYIKAVNKWKELATIEIERSLAKRATGFTKKTKKDVVTRAGTIETLETETYYPPDTAAVQFWLKNKNPEEWKDKSEVDVNVIGNIRAWLINAEAESGELIDVTPVVKDNDLEGQSTLNSNGQLTLNNNTNDEMTLNNDIEGQFTLKVNENGEDGDGEDGDGEDDTDHATTPTDPLAAMNAKWGR